MTRLETREKNIFDIAKAIIPNARNLDEVTIDTEFIFRFEHQWCREVLEIRKLLNSYMNLPGNGPLPTDKALQWIIHMNNNPDLKVGFEWSQNSSSFFAYTKHLNDDYEYEKRGYSPFNKEVSAKVKDDLFSGSGIGSLANELIYKINLEAELTSEVKNRIGELLWKYGLLPSVDLSGAFSQEEIQSFYIRSVNWILMEEVVPTFCWSEIRYIENRTDKRVTRTIRPHRAILGKWVPNKSGGEIWIKKKLSNKRMNHETRVRTWAIYFLTKRGGGKRTEEDGVDIWNQKLQKYDVHVKNYQKERDRLFSKVSRKTVR